MILATLSTPLTLPPWRASRVEPTVGLRGELSGAARRRLLSFPDGHPRRLLRPLRCRDRRCRGRRERAARTVCARDPAPPGALARAARLVQVRERAAHRIVQDPR